MLDRLRTEFEVMLDRLRTEFEVMFDRLRTEFEVKYVPRRFHVIKSGPKVHEIFNESNRRVEKLE